MVDMELDIVIRGKALLDDVWALSFFFWGGGWGSRPE